MSAEACADEELRLLWAICWLSAYQGSNGCSVCLCCTRFCRKLPAPSFMLVCAFFIGLLILSSFNLESVSRFCIVVNLLHSFCAACAAQRTKCQESGMGNQQSRNGHPAKQKSNIQQKTWYSANPYQALYKSLPRPLLQRHLFSVRRRRTKELKQPIHRFRHRRIKIWVEGLQGLSQIYCVRYPEQDRYNCFLVYWLKFYFTKLL